MAEIKRKTVSLDRLNPGEKGRIGEMRLETKTSQKLEDMGLIQGRTVECAYRSPWGDPTAYYVMGTLIAIRGKEARNIKVEVGSGMGK